MFEEYRKNERVLVSLVYELEYDNENDEEDIVFYEVEKWLPGEIKEITYSSVDDTEIVAYKVEISLAYLNILELDPSKWSIITVNGNDNDRRICKLSEDNLVTFLETEELLDAEIQIDYISEIKFTELVDLATSVGNASSLDWLYNKKKTNSLDRFKFNFQKILLNAARSNKANIIVWVYHNYSDKETSWYNILRITDNDNRNIFHIALAIEGHGQFVHNIIDSFECYNEEHKVNELISCIVSMMKHSRDLEGRTCFHLAALKGNIISLMNIMYYLFKRLYDNNYDYLFFSASDTKCKGIEYFIDSNNNIDKQTVTEIVDSTCCINTIKEYKKYVQDFKCLIANRKYLVRLADAFRCNTDPYNNEFDTLSDIDYDNLIFDVLIDESISFDHYFNTMVLPLLISQVIPPWEGFDNMFHRCISFGYHNEVKLLLALKLVDRTHFNSSFDLNGRTAVENACYGNWKSTRDVQVCRFRSNYTTVTEELVRDLFVQWDETIVEDAVRYDFNETSLWDTLDKKQRKNNYPDYSCLDNRTYYKGIQPRGYIDIVMFLLNYDCFYPTCKFVIDHCDKYMSEWFIRYRIAMKEVLIYLFGDLHDLISSYLFVDFKECRESISRTVLSAPITGNNEKCLYLLDMLLKEFGVDPFLRGIRVDEKKSESILHYAVRGQHFLCVKYILCKYEYLLDKESLQEGMLPINIAIQQAESEGNSFLIASMIIDLKVEKVIKQGLDIFRSISDYKARIWKAKMFILDMKDSSGRSTKEFAMINNDYLDMKIIASLTSLGDAYIHLIQMVREGEMLEEIVTYCNFIGGRLMLKNYNQEFSNSDYSQDKFGTLDEQKFLFVCLSMDRWDVIEWYSDDMYDITSEIDNETDISRVTLWRFNSLDINKLDGKGVLYCCRNELRNSFPNEETRQLFYNLFSAKYIAEFYGHVELRDFIHELEMEYIEKQEITKFIYRNEEIAKCEGPITFHQDPVTSLSCSGFRPAIIKGLSVEEIEFEFEKGKEVLNRFRDSLTLEESKDLLDSRCDESDFFILNMENLLYVKNTNVAEYCITNNFLHILKWIINQISLDYEGRVEFIHKCMICAISYGRMDFIKYLLDISGIGDIDTLPLVLAAASHLELDIFKYFYEQLSLNNRPSVESILIEMVERNHYYYQKSLFSYNTEINEEITNHLRTKADNRKQLFDYFVTNGSLNSESSSEIAYKLILSYCIRSVNISCLYEILMISYAPPIMCFDLVRYVVEEIGIDVSKFRIDQCREPDRNVIDLVQKKKNEARVINAIERGDDIVVLEKLEKEVDIDISGLRGRDGIFMLHFATLKKHVHIVDWILTTKPHMDTGKFDKFRQIA